MHIYHIYYEQKHWQYFHIYDNMFLATTDFYHLPPLPRNYQGSLLSIKYVLFDFDRTTKTVKFRLQIL